MDAQDAHNANGELPVRCYKWVNFDGRQRPREGIAIELLAANLKFISVFSMPVHFLRGHHFVGLFYLDHIRQFLYGKTAEVEGREDGVVSDNSRPVATGLGNDKEQAISCRSANDLVFNGDPRLAQEVF